jgi:hypothetical protein
MSLSLRRDPGDPGSTLSESPGCSISDTLEGLGGRGLGDFLNEFFSFLKGFFRLDFFFSTSVCVASELPSRPGVDKMDAPSSKFEDCIANE